MLMELAPRISRPTAPSTREACTLVSTRSRVAAGAVHFELVDSAVSYSPFRSGFETSVTAVLASCRPDTFVGSRLAELTP
ncbi:hypothetical protein NL676_007045 [Syzygium grande]|nr:hypothetical protein NL676_007045 [Syzygium grande]